MSEHFFVIGAGLTGSVIAERLVSRGHRVSVIEKRNHIGGNLYEEGGVHKYGPHIFHTNSLKIFNYLSMFTEWRPYIHKVLCSVDQKLIPIPFNFNSIRIIYSNDQKKSDALISKLSEVYGYGANVPILKMMEENNDQIRGLANFVYEKIFLGYSQKQWGIDPKSLDKSVMARVPVRCSFDDRYFLDTHQAMPKHGYMKMFESLLSGADVSLGESPDLWRKIENNKIVYTGCIDEFFDYKFGRLPYRSTDFVFLPTEWTNEETTINFPNDHDYTRITNMEKLTGNVSKNNVCYEFPGNCGDPCYPVPCKESDALYKKYEKLADELRGRVWFAGRLGQYKYLNMDQAVGSALTLFEREFQ